MDSVKEKKEHQFPQATATCKTRSRAETTLAMRAVTVVACSVCPRDAQATAHPDAGHQVRLSRHLGACLGGCGRTELMSDLSAL